MKPILIIVGLVIGALIGAWIGANPVGGYLGQQQFESPDELSDLLFWAFVGCGAAGAITGAIIFWLFSRVLGIQD